MCNQPSPAQQAITLLDTCSSRAVTDEDVRQIDAILVAQLRQQVERGIQRATEAMDSELDRALAPADNILGAPPPTEDPVRPGFEVETEETRIVLEVARQLRTRMTEHQQERTERTTLWVAKAAVLVALLVGAVQIIVTVLTSHITPS
jgi:hypothetical protein